MPFTSGKQHVRLSQPSGWQSDTANLQQLDVHHTFPDVIGHNQYVPPALAIVSEEGDKLKRWILCPRLGVCIGSIGIKSYVLNHASWWTQAEAIFENMQKAL